MLLALINAAGGKIEEAQRGIIFIDEIDKKVSVESHSSSGKDINGTAVQEELLKIIEPSVVYIGKESKPFDTHGLTIICGGRFKGLDKIRDKRLGKSNLIGFNNNDSQENSYDEDENFSSHTNFDYTDDDLIKYGFIDEFVGRFLPPIEFKKLTVDTLIQIIYSRDSTFQQLINVFNSRGVDLIVDDGLLMDIAEECAQSDTGARKLEGKIFSLLRKALYDTEQNFCSGIIEIDRYGNYTAIFKKRNSDGLIVNSSKIEREASDDIY